MAGDAAVDADPGGAGNMGYLQDEVPGEVLSRQCEARAGGRVLYPPAGNYDRAGLHRAVRVFSSFLYACSDRGVKVQKV